MFRLSFALFESFAMFKVVVVNVRCVDTVDGDNMKEDTKLRGIIDKNNRPPRGFIP